MLAIVDAGPLLAAANAADPDHARCLAVLGRRDLQLVIAAPAVAEVSYLLGARAGPTAEAAFLRGLAAYDVEAPRGEDWLRVAELVERYADLSLGGTDASIVALAERLDTDVVVTLDRRHFGVVRPRHRAALRLLPEQESH